VSKKKGLRQALFFLCSLLPVYCVAPAAASVNDPSVDQANSLEEVVVTARKRSESIIEVPESITAFGAVAIQDFNIQKFDDYATKVPNLAFTYGQGGTGVTDSTTVAIRGISGAGTTGFYIDDTPILLSIDPRVIDIDRIEVLKGPQGTLYGESSMGGNVRLVTAKPIFDGDDIKYMVQGGATSGGGSPDYGGDVVGNLIAIPDLLAIRAMLFGNHDAGFLTRTYPAPDAAGRLSSSNQSAVTTYGGSLAALLKVTDKFDVIFRYLDQEQSYDGLPEAFAPLPAFTPVYVLNRTTNTQESAYNHFWLASIDANYRGQGFTVTSSTSYYHNHNEETEDGTEGTDEFFNNFFGAVLSPSSAVTQVAYTYTTQFAEEARISASIFDRLSLIAGVYLARGWIDDGYPNTPVAGLEQTGLYPNNQLVIYDQRLRNDSAAAFGELYYKFLQDFTLTLGGRYFYLQQESAAVGNGFFTGGPYDTGDLKSQQTGFSPKVALAYAVTENSNVYALFSKGFRPGGPEAPVVTVCQAGLGGLPDTSFKSDTVDNYEVGAKSSLLNGRAYVTAAAFQMNWSDIQQNVVLPCGESFRTNTGEARIRGAELEVNGQVLPGLDIRVGIGAENAIITNPGLSAVTVGERVFQVPRFNGTTGFVYTFGGERTYRPFISADYSYVGDRLSANNSPQNTPLVEPAYSILNARMGVKFGQSELSLYANNVTNEKANLGDIQQNDFPQSIKNSSGQTVPYLEVGVLPPLQIGVQFKQSF
jgi:iron complex outermembrane recepter protein